MSVDIRLPNITAQSDREQIQQIRSYLYQFASQMKWALNTVKTGSDSESIVQASVSSPSATGTTEDDVAQFNSIKALIIKSADIINAYYDAMSVKFSGEYVAQSDFGAYKETTDAEIIANSTAIQQNYVNIQDIVSDLNVIMNQIDTRAYIRTGLLYYADDGTPVYGVEVGQENTVGGEKVFSKFARFVSDRLSFYDANDTEVAYISDYKLYITNAQVIGNLQLGDYLLDTTDGLAFI